MPGLIDPGPVIQYFMQRGLQTDLLRKCNSIQYRFIGGAGDGYFLTDRDTYLSILTGDTISSDILGGPTRTLQIVGTLYVDHPTSTGKRLVILHVAEPKYKLSRQYVTRNYNVFVRRSYVSDRVDIVPPDATPKTLRQIIEDIFGAAITYSAPTVYPFDVFIEGMSELDAIDRLCAAHGFFWTYDGTTLKVFDSVAMPSPDYTKMMEITFNDVANPVRDISVTFPVLDCCLEKPTQFYNSSQAIASDVPGGTLNTYYPYYPAIIDRTTGTVLNISAITITRNALRDRYTKVEQNADRNITYPEFKNINLDAQPSYFRIYYADYGAGPRTILDSRKYPYIHLPELEQIDNQAKNWVGYLYEGYKGVVPGFWVTPGFGIDGRLPVIRGDEPAIWVVNLYKWNFGDAGAAVRVEWDCVNYRWIPLQQEYRCPPSEPGPPQTPPPVSVVPPTTVPPAGNWS